MIFASTPVKPIHSGSSTKPLPKAMAAFSCKPRRNCAMDLTTYIRSCPTRRETRTGSLSPSSRSVISISSGDSIGRALCSLPISAPAFSRARRRRISSIAPVEMACIIAAAR